MLGSVLCSFLAGNEILITLIQLGTQNIEYRSFS